MLTEFFLCTSEGRITLCFTNRTNHRVGIHTRNPWVSLTNEIEKSYFESKGICYNLPQQNGLVLGLGGGVFAATAISISESLSDLVLIGPECMRAAFRFHIHVNHISQTIEPRVITKNCKVWGYTLTGCSEALVKQEIDLYNAPVVCFDSL